jgi:hypothetical protein
MLAHVELDRKNLRVYNGNAPALLHQLRAVRLGVPVTKKPFHLAHNEVEHLVRESLESSRARDTRDLAEHETHPLPLLRKYDKRGRARLVEVRVNKKERGDLAVVGTRRVHERK